MNRKIDILAALFALVAICFTLLLLATGDLPIALALTYALGVLARIFWVKWFKRLGVARRDRKNRLASARALVAHWALHPDEEAARRYVESVYPASCPFVLLPRHPEGSPTGVDALLDIWRRHEGCDRLVIATTARVDGKAMSLCRTLQKPRAAILDCDVLARVIADGTLDIPHVAKSPPPRHLNIRLDKKQAPRVALCALSSLFIYCVTGGTIYLICALSLLFLAGVGLAKRPRPEGLF